MKTFDIPTDSGHYGGHYTVLVSEVLIVGPVKKEGDYLVFDLKLRHLDEKVTARRALRQTPAITNVEHAERDCLDHLRQVRSNLITAINTQP